MAVLADAQTRSTSLLADASAVPNARLFATGALTEWGLPVVAADVCTCLSELATWLLANGPQALIDIALVWDGPLLVVEVADRGERLPNRRVWLGSGEHGEGGFAVAILEAVCVEWGSEHDWRGRVLWASYRTDLAQPLPAGVR